MASVYIYGPLEVTERGIVLTTHQEIVSAHTNSSRGCVAPR